jgi:energy-coupling factor transporter ATP-binding protein EcfA2
MDASITLLLIMDIPQSVVNGKVWNNTKSDVMDKFDPLVNEREFVKLINAGKSLEEISQFLRVPVKSIEEWVLKSEKDLFKAITAKTGIPGVALRSILTNPIFILRAWANTSSARLSIGASTFIPETDLLFNLGMLYGVTHHAENEQEDYDYVYETITAIFKLFSDPTEDKYHDGHAKAALPFVLKKIEIENYQSIARSCIEDIPVDTQWIFLTGENGYGKTTLLQAIAIGLLGSRDGDNILVDNSETRISTEFKENGRNTIHHLGIPFQPMTNLVAYGSARLEIQNTQSQSRIDEQITTSYSLFNTDGVLQNIEFELYKWSLKGDKKFNAVKKLFKQLIPQLHDIKVDKERDEVLYVEQDAHGKAFEAVPFRKLASGFRSIIAMIGDMVIRLYKQQPKVINPQKLSGIVLIDEFDLHLHPKWQRELPVLLSTAFPLVQFIVSTHSVIPFLGAPPNSVFLKVTRDRKKGIQVEKLDIDIKNLLPNTILTSAIFDMDNITQRNNEDLAAVRTEDNFKEVLENDEIQKKLKQFEESDADFPTDLFKEA